MSNKKYEFTGETKEWCGHTLHRIRAIVGAVEAIEEATKEDNQ